jgi:hypothetical protein
VADSPVVASLQVGTGPPFAADLDAGSAYWPYAKLAWGASGTQNEVADASGKRLPVKIGEGLSAAAVVSGQVGVTGAEAALPNVTVRRVKLRSLLTNTMTNPIYIGPTGVSAATGFPLFPGDTIELELSNLNVVHAFVASGTETLCYVGEV